MHKMLWSAMAVSALWAGQAGAVNTDNYDIPYAGGFLAYEFGDSSRNSDNGVGFQITGGMPIDWHTGNALELSFYNVGRERDIDGNDDYQSVLMLDLVHDFGLFGWGDDASSKYLPKFKPFVLAGIGVVQDDVAGDDHIHLGGNVGAGLFVPLPWYGAAVRGEWRVQLHENNESVPNEDILIDYRINLGVQFPLTPLFARSEPKVEKPIECDLAVVDPETGRSDCGDDSDRDGVVDGVDQCPGTPEGTPVDSRGCPAARGGAADSDGDGVPDLVDSCPETHAGIVVDVNGCAVGQTLTLRNVYFLNDTAELTPEAKAVLDEVVQTLKGQPNIRVEVGGHTDSIGSQAYNLMLSEQRAEAVRQYLIARGIEPTRLTAQGYGEFRPVVSNEMPGDRVENRRVEFKLIVQ